MANFKDNFSQQSDTYLKYRPQYPVELFNFLASLTESHNLAWDCGTGNGQAAISLTDFYDHIIATDPSEAQIKNAIEHEKVEYKVEKSEHNSLLSNSVDLITIANALHWFDFDVFYKEAIRVLKPNGIIAAWSYPSPTVSPEVDAIIMYLHSHTLKDFWQYENSLVEKRYTTIPFPFQEIKCPDFFIERKVNLNDLIGFTNTWSATQRFINTHHYNPTEQFKEELKKVWPDSLAEKTIRWELFLKVGRK